MASNVVTTLHSDDAHRCIKVMRQPDGTFGLREFRRDPEDAGNWTLVRDYGRGDYATPQQAVSAAQDNVAWLSEKLSGTR